MPELPEVETVRRGLDAALKGARIEKVLLKRGDLRLPFPKNFARILAGRTIRSIDRRAKYLFFHFDTDDVLIAHLGMTGRFSVEIDPPAKWKMHDHVIFHLEDGRCVVFNDTRRFGLMALTKKKYLATHPFFAALGPEPFSKEFSASYLKKQLAGRKGPIKPVLMDQRLVVGVGNIYASEALFLARTDPRKPARDVADRAALLVKSIRQVLQDAITSGGSSLRDFLHVSGEAGYFQHRFNVYGRKGKPCSRCGHPIRALSQAGRTTFFCEHCQR